MKIIPRTIAWVARYTIPSVKQLNLEKYLCNQLLHKIVRTGYYSPELKHFILLELGMEAEYNELKQEDDAKSRLYLRSKYAGSKYAQNKDRINQRVINRLLRKIAIKEKREVLGLDSGSHTCVISDPKELEDLSGWEGHEIILEDLIAQLLNYTNIRVQRQLALRDKDKTSKVATRRADLVLFYKYIHQSTRKKTSSLICIELKTNYIDATDVTDCWYTKQYLQKAVEAFPCVRDATMLFLSPLGTTEAANQELLKINSRYNNNHPKRAYSATVSQFVETIYWCAKYTYRDEEGAIGKQWSFVKPEIEKLIWKINNPKFWLKEYLKLDRKVDLEIKYEKS